MILLLTELRVKIKKLIRCLLRAILLHCGPNDAQPELGDGLVVTACWLIGNMIGGVVSADPIPQLHPRNLEAVTHQVKISQFDVCPVMPLIERKCAILKLPDKIVVIHCRV